LRTRLFKCQTQGLAINCPNCESAKVHIHQKTKRKVKDIVSSNENSATILEISVTRYRCTQCKKTFTPPIPGIAIRAKCTERLRRKILWACDNFADLKKVRNVYKMGNSSIYRHYFKALELKVKHQINKPWPKVLGVDEHAFNRNKKLGFRNFVTMFVDHKQGRPFELLPVRETKTLIQMCSSISGRENVEWISMDLSSTYRSFARQMFPQAKITADPFHVIKLLHPAINKYRLEITSRDRKHPLRKLLLKRRDRISWDDKIFIEHWLKNYPQLRALYLAKENLHTLYRCRGVNCARRVLEKLIVELEKTSIKELKTLRRTLLSWKTEILNYFIRRVSNARCEGLNNVAKSIIKRSYGLTNFANYRLRVLNA
jgi:transposase